MKSTHARFAACLAMALALPGAGFAQTGHDQTGHDQGEQMMDHAAHMGGQAATEAPTQAGQSAFAAIAEIVDILRGDRHTDWAKVDIAALRAHLVDMDAVTLRAQVVASDVQGGAQFDVTSSDPGVTASIRRMTLAHGQTMSGIGGLRMQATKIPGGARMVVSGPDAAQIRGLGFFGVMTLGMHHQAHHIALARGLDPHD